MHFIRLFLLFLLNWLPCLVQGERTLLEDYTGAQFFEKMNFFDQADPTNGHIQYLDMHTANATGLTGTVRIDGSTDASVYLGTDSTNKTPNGRPSIRVSSKRAYDSGLFIADIAHMPGGVCGTWPALWLLGTAAPWPEAGEIDIIEGVNTQTADKMSLHVSETFQVSNDTTSMTGTLLSSDAYIHSLVQPHNTGAVVEAFVADGPSFGTAFNVAGGGVYATEVSSAANHIKVWFFPRGSIPADIQNGTDPQPSTWGTPMASFAGKDLDFAARFRGLQIVINLSYCGDWAGKPEIWGESAECAALAPTCDEYVSNHPEAFADMYWAINSLKVYEASDGKVEETSSVASSSAEVPAPSASAVVTARDVRPSGYVSVDGGGARPHNGTFGHNCTDDERGSRSENGTFDQGRSGRPGGGRRPRPSRIQVDEETESKVGA